MRLIVYIFILSILLTSCAYFSVPIKIRNGLGYCHKNEYNGIDTLINIKGVFKYGVIYYELNSNGHYVPGQDTSFNNLIFYTNGSFVKNINSNGFNSISDYFNEIIRNPEEEKSKAFFKWLYWGEYIIYGDTIKVRYLNHPYTLSPTWVAYEEWYRIIDKNTLEWIDTKKLYPTSSTSYYEKIKKQRTFLRAKFIPLDVIPNSNCWLKEEKWFWCNKEDYKKWKKEMKENK